MFALSGCFKEDMKLPQLDQGLLVNQPIDQTPSIKSQIKWGSRGFFAVYLEVEDLENSQITRNYEYLRSNWSEFIPVALYQLDRILQEYEREGHTFDPSKDFFHIMIPNELISDNAEWSFCLESEPG